MNDIDSRLIDYSPEYKAWDEDNPSDNTNFGIPDRRVPKFRGIGKPVDTGYRTESWRYSFGSNE